MIMPTEKDAPVMTTAAPDIFPETLPFEVEITGIRHQLMVGEFYGLSHALETLDKIPEPRRAPGFAYAYALLEREMADAKASMTARNLQAIAKAGHDINRVGNVSLRGFALHCT